MAKIDLTSREWCELVFEGRNKTYGAYELRKTSPKRHNIAMLIILIAAIIAFSMPALLKLAIPARVEDETIFDPDDREVKAMVNVLKNIDQIVHEKEYSLKKPFVSRVKFDESIKGALYNVSDPCFLLISQLTGRTGIKLLGYKED